MTLSIRSSTGRPGLHCGLSRVLAMACLWLAWAGGPGAWAATAPTAAAPQASPQTAPQSAPKVLRYALRIAETGFDPAKVTDLYSHIIICHLFEGLYGYDPLARPARIKPLTAAALPEVSADFRVFTIRLKQGIYFADDPAFKGQRRELVAQDYVYAIQRMADPANKSPNWSDLEETGFIGLAEARQEALDKRQAFDYDRPIPGLRALDRYTLRIELKASRPRLIELLTGSDRLGAVAREVVQAYGDQIDAHPVGTGPFRLAQWRRSSLIVLERNPGYRERFYDAQPNADDPEGQALLARFKGRRLPMVDRVEVSIIEEPQPRWLAFLNHQQDFIERVPEEFISVAMPGNRLAPNLAKLGIQGYRTLAADVILTTYNMEDPVVGGYKPEKVALRRALNLAMNVPREIDLVRRGQAIPAQAILLPHTSGYDPAFKSEMSDYDPARARALLDLFGYVDRDGDGWRDLPTGQPLVLQRNSQPDQQSRALDDLWVRDMRAIGVRAEVRTAKWPENYKAARAGNYMMWWLGNSATQMDGQSALTLVYGPQTGMGNLARFKNTELDALYDRMQSLPDGPERNALFHQAKRIAVAYAPYKNHLHRYITDMAHPWVIGFRRPPLWQDWWQYVDIDPAKLPADLARLR